MEAGLVQVLGVCCILNHFLYYEKEITFIRVRCQPLCAIFFHERHGSRGAMATIWYYSRDARSVALSVKG